MFPDLEPDLEQKVKDIQKAGYIFEIEMLRTGQVSATIADPKIDEDVAFAKIVPNGPQVPVVINNMIREFKL
jgi:hypothetical protein